MFHLVSIEASKSYNDSQNLYMLTISKMAIPIFIWGESTHICDEKHSVHIVQAELLQARCDKHV